MRGIVVPIYGLAGEERRPMIWNHRH